MLLHFPDAGVNRRLALQRSQGKRERYFAPWAVNCMVEDNLDRRLRGGSRPGLTKFVADDMGTTIADMASIQLSSASSGSSEVLFILVDSAIKTVEGGTTTTQVAYLTNESGDILTNAGGDRLVVSSGTAPSSGFLITGQQQVFAVTTAGVTKMDPKTGQVDALAASAGSIPTNCTFGCIYRDRMVLSGEDNAIYVSRQGDFTDWNYADHVRDQQRAYAFQLSLGSDVGDKPTAAIPCLDNYMICATARSLWVAKGDATAGGTLERISESVGIIGAKAWAKIDTGIVFLSEDGLYQVQADGSNLTALTPDIVPDELRDIDTTTTTVSLGWDQERRAFHIYLRTSGGSDTHWIYETRQQAFWPVRYQDDHSPLAVCVHQGQLLLAGGDGYVRKVAGDDDDGSNIESHVLIGPLQLGSLDTIGLIQELHGLMAAGSATVDWRIVYGTTAEEAADNGKLAIEAAQAGSSYASYVRGSGSWSAGRSSTERPRTSAMHACIWLSSTGKWAFEAMTMRSIQSGKWRA